MDRAIIDDNHKVVPCADLLAWAGWFGDAEKRRVARDEIADVVVSTVFLGLNHGHEPLTPLWFETMVFGGKLNEESERYATWEEAIAGHAAMCKRVRA